MISWWVASVNLGVQSVQLKEAKVNLLSTGMVPKRQHRLLNCLKVTWSRVNKTSVTWGHINIMTADAEIEFLKKSHFHGYSSIIKSKWFYTIQYHFVHYYNIYKFRFEWNCCCVPSSLAIKKHCIKTTFACLQIRGYFTSWNTLVLFVYAYYYEAIGIIVQSKELWLFSSVWVKVNGSVPLAWGHWHWPILSCVPADAWGWHWLFKMINILSRINLSRWWSSKSSTGYVWVVY